MDEIFGSIVYLIPIALIIFRVVGGLNGQKRKQQQQRQQQKTEVRLPPVSQQVKPVMLPHWEEEPVPEPPVKKTTKVKTKAVKTPAAEPARGYNMPPAGTRRDLTPLQQALVWSEILGPPRSELT